MGKIIDRLEEFIIGTLMAVATVVIFVSVVHRYGTGFEIPGVQDWLLEINMGWAQEFCIILFVWMAKFGAAYGVRTGIHVGVDIVINKLPSKPRAVMVQLGLFCGVLFTAVIGVFGAAFVWENGMAYETLSLLGSDTGAHFEGPTTPDLEWPTWMVYSAVPLGSFLMCFRFIQVMIKFARSGELPTHDHGHVEGLEEGEVLVVGEAIAIAEQREHAHAGLSDADWEKEHGAEDAANKEK
ncbi:TRAP transporter small permease [Azonexus caeni]|jgi:C4-dicarboxylate transporter DctQ subunit|uniref:TRAP transporter small permease n=1 Tax=Azonexus caeni TaxID=266126 RepID=UPI002B82E122|nr:TRAP transporter small permease [Azonexus sp.]